MRLWEKHKQLKPGDVVADTYLLEEEIGRGGMGLVFRARHQHTQQIVALKTLHPRLADQPTSNQRFIREVETARQLQNPHTVTVHDMGWGNGTLFFTMELLDGLSLDACLRSRGALPPRLALRITFQILQSLTEAHALDIIHRDLTPANVFLCRKPRDPYYVKILDFGLAKLVGSKQQSTQLTGGGMALGTLPYMAPEQLQRRGVCPATDLYAVGQLLYEMLAGKNLYHGLNNGQIMEHKLNSRPLDIRDTPLAGPLAAVLIKALQRSPTRRYQNAEQMRQHLLILARMLDDPDNPLDNSGEQQSPPGQQTIELPTARLTSPLPVQREENIITSPIPGAPEPDEE